MRKAVAAALALCLLLTLPVQALAAVDDLEGKRQKLEQAYGIQIRYDLDKDDKAIITVNDLNTLDRALGCLTADLVRQVSAHYEATMGKKLVYSFTRSQIDTGDPSLIVLGHFEEKTAIISLCIPGAKGAVATGNSPLTILHEFAHAYHAMAAKKHGADRMEKEWTALNGSVSNNEGYMVYPYNKLVFISSYAASNYKEDFAETFAHAFGRGREGQGFYHRLATGGKKTALGKKVDYLQTLLPQYLSGSGAAVSNLGKIYDTPVFLHYQGVKLSGEELQFIGFSAPRHVLKGITAAHGFKAEASQWIPEIGGWQVLSDKGDAYLAFPGGELHPLSGPLDLAA